MSRETLAIEDLLSLEGETGERWNVGDEQEWGSCCRQTFPPDKENGTRSQPTW